MSPETQRVSVPTRTLVPVGIAASANDSCGTCRQLNEAPRGGEGIFERCSACNKGCGSVPTHDHAPHTSDTFSSSFLPRRLRKERCHGQGDSFTATRTVEEITVVWLGPVDRKISLALLCHSVLIRLAGSVEFPRIL